MTDCFKSDIRQFTGKYLMKQITPKNGILRNVHVSVLDKVCELRNVYDESPSAIFHYRRDDGMDRYVHTSYIVNILEDGNRLVIETRNTVYELEVIE